jgi:hypothetical protein
MTRNGKIARLPRAVRDELNRRLDDGEQGSGVLAWLNGREDVQAVLTAHFSGLPINKQNLSEWRGGGFAEWRQQQETWGAMHEILTQENAHKLMKGRKLSEVAAQMAALALGRSLQAVLLTKDSPEKVRATTGLVHELVRLRTSERNYERAQREEGPLARAETAAPSGPVKPGQTG